MISQKTSRQVFHSNEHKCVDKKKIVEKLLSFERWKELCWRPLNFISKSILYVYQNVKWNQRKSVPKIYQNIPPKKYIFLLKVAAP
jgi:hypothetical protein